MTTENINYDQFTYSKRSHFEFFNTEALDMKLFGISVNSESCDLKAYQDLLSLYMLCNIVTEGSKILEVGGGDSRVLGFLSANYECWNLDKLEGVGNGPKELKDKGYNIVLDYIGNHNPELPKNYFDIVFSISALEHVQIGDESVYEAIRSEINSLLKPGGYSFHCIDHTTDLLLGEVDEVWTNPLIEYLFAHQNTLNKFIPLLEAESDPDLFVVSSETYSKYWEPVTGVPYEKFGKPFSYNVFWRK